MPAIARYQTKVCRTVTAVTLSFIAYNCAMADAPESLLRYEPPQLVVKGHQRASTKVPTFARDTALPPTEVVLNAILPPRKFEKNGKLWVQHASSVPATHLDMDALKELLELRLQQRHAREMGICPEREALYAQLFDEIIRQVTVGCAERGLLLLRVRNETMQNIYEYQNLYKSSTGCGIRVSLLAEQQQTEAAAQVGEPFL